MAKEDQSSKPQGAEESMKKRLKGEQRLNDFEKIIGFKIPKEKRDQAVSEIASLETNPDSYVPAKLYNYIIGEKEWNTPKGDLNFAKDKAIYAHGVDPSKVSEKALKTMPDVYGNNPITGKPYTEEAKKNIIKEHFNAMAKDTTGEYEKSLPESYSEYVKREEEDPLNKQSIQNKKSKDKAEYESIVREAAFQDRLIDENKSSFIEGMARNYIKNDSNPKLKDKSEKTLLEMAHGDWNINTNSNLFSADKHRSIYKDAILNKVNEIKQNEQSEKQSVKNEYAGMNPDQVIAYYSQKYKTPIANSSAQASKVISKMDDEIDQMAAAKLGKKYSTQKGLY
jgi:hypothetical protein